MAWWALTIIFATISNGHLVTVTSRQGQYSTYDLCSRAAAREDTDLSVHMTDTMGNRYHRVGLAQCTAQK